MIDKKIHLGIASIYTMFAIFCAMGAWTILPMGLSLLILMVIMIICASVHGFFLLKKFYEMGSTVLQDVQSSKDNIRKSLDAFSQSIDNITNYNEHLEEKVENCLEYVKNYSEKIEELYQNQNNILDKLHNYKPNDYKHENSMSSSAQTIQTPYFDSNDGMLSDDFEQVTSFDIQQASSQSEGNKFKSDSFFDDAMSQTSSVSYDDSEFAEIGDLHQPESDINSTTPQEYDATNNLSDTENIDDIANQIKEWEKLEMPKSSDKHISENENIDMPFVNDLTLTSMSNNHVQIQHNPLVFNNDKLPDFLGNENVNYDDDILNEEFVKELFQEIPNTKPSVNSYSQPQIKQKSKSPVQNTSHIYPDIANEEFEDVTNLLKNMRSKADISREHEYQNENFKIDIPIKSKILRDISMTSYAQDNQEEEFIHSVIMKKAKDNIKNTEFKGIDSKTEENRTNDIKNNNDVVLQEEFIVPPLSIQTQKKNTQKSPNLDSLNASNSNITAGLSYNNLPSLDELLPQEVQISQNYSQKKSLIHTEIPSLQSIMDIDILEKNPSVLHEKSFRDNSLSVKNDENNTAPSLSEVSDSVTSNYSVHETQAVNMTVSDIPITNPMINIAPYPLSDVMKSVRYALERNAIDTCVLPIIHAGDKQTYFYHTYSYLRDKDDLYHNSSDFMSSLKQTGLDIAIDKITIIRSVQAIKALHYANYALGLFVTANLKTVTHDDFFDELMDMLQEKTKIADGLIFHFTQAQISGLTAVRIDRLLALHQQGVLFSLGGIDDNLPDLTELVKIGFKFIHLSQHNIKEGIMINHQDINAIYMHSLCQKLGMQMILSDINNHDDVLNIVNVKADFLHGKAFGTLEKLEHIQL